MNKFITLTSIALFTATFLGCSSNSSRPPTYPVTGTVTFKGKPVPNATVILVPAGSAAAQESAAGVTDADGKFQLTTYNANDGAQVGEYQVKVSQYDAKPPAKKNESITMEEEQKLAFSGQEIPTPPSKNLLPKKYESESTSGLVHTVTKSPTTLEITIQ